MCYVIGFNSKFLGTDCISILRFQIAIENSDSPTTYFLDSFLSM